MSDLLAVVFFVPSIVLAILLYRKQNELEHLRNKNEQLEKALAAAMEKISAYEARSGTDDGLLDKAVRGLVALGTPGLVLLVAMAVSGFAGAAAITSALAALGGPMGMLGGIGVLVLLGLVSGAMAKWGFPRIANAVVRGLVACRR